MTYVMRRLAIGILGLCAAIGAIAPACAQPKIGGDFGLGILDTFDPAGDEKLITIASQFTAPTADRPAVLTITAKVAPGWHVFAITQAPGGPQATKIRLTPSTQYQQIGPFRAWPEPESHIDKTVWPGLELQEHEREVTWYAPIALAPGVDPATLEIKGQIEWQVCKESCVPGDAEITARLGEGVPIGPIESLGRPVDSGPLSPPMFEGSYQPVDSVVNLSGRLEPAVVRPGQSARLVITATPSPGWHVYAFSPYDNKPGSKPTLITFQTLAGLIPRWPTTDAAVKIDSSVPQFGPMRYHDGPVTWVTQIDVPADMPPGDYPIRGLMGYQACEYRADGRGSCELPRALQFAGILQVGEGSGAAESPLTFATMKSYTEVAVVAATWADAPEEPATTGPESADPIAKNADPLDTGPAVRARDAYDLSQVRIVEESSSSSLAYYIGLAFVGGLILNLMPCVLPVIGLKVMSFVQQSGKSRAHALMLNVWYSAGIVAVFLLLGLLAATLGLSWGGQFGSTTFNVVMASIVFAMALSLLGVWEVPIPGFLGRGAAQDLAAKEGPLGAFSKGVITTILATPCTAPFMATAIAWAVTQSLATTLAVFTAVGLGMSSPYLVVGVFPELLRFLPKPGAWMETFKQLSGFVLLATVVFILSFMEAAAVVPTVALLVGIGAACWILSRTQYFAEWNERLKSFALAGAVIVLFSVASFGWLYRELMLPRYAGLQVARAGGADGEWQPFSLEILKSVAVDEGRTVLVDFSADWCASCKVLEATVLHTKPVEQAIAAAGVATMYADFTRYPPEIKNTIHALRSNGVPVIAIFPGDRPYEPIVFRGGYTQSGLIAALEKATGRRLQGDDGTVAEASTAVAPLN
jgi:suppressor for copper-sensitivity B